MVCWAEVWLEYLQPAGVRNMIVADRNGTAMRNVSDLVAATWRHELLDRFVEGRERTVVALLALGAVVALLTLGAVAVHQFQR